MSRADVAEAIVAGSDSESHIEKIRECADAAFDHVFLHRTGPRQTEFVDFAERAILPESE